MSQWYREDLAYIHDVGHRDYALKSAPGILKILTENNVKTGLIVDLGCGSGLSALEFTRAGYQVLGIDISDSLIKIAIERVISARFRVESLFKSDIPPCNVVTSIGECLNYLFDTDSASANLSASGCCALGNRQKLLQLFQRIYNALLPGGVFIFDIAQPGQLGTENPDKFFTQGDDWFVLVEKSEDREQETLTRHITTFRQVGEYYRRNDELHHLQLYKATDLAEELQHIGFQVEIRDSYGDYCLPKAHAVAIAVKKP